MSTYILTGEGFYLDKVMERISAGYYSSTKYNKPNLGINPFVINSVTNVLDFSEETQSDFKEWLNITINFCKERGYILNGSLHYQSEYTNDIGYIEINNNEIKHLKGVVVYVPPKYEEIIPKVVNMYLDEPLKDLIDVYIKNKEKEYNG